MTPEETQLIHHAANSRTTEARLVERATSIWLLLTGKSGKAVAAALRVNPATVRQWVKRFTQMGWEDLEAAPRLGKPATYTPEQVGEVVGTALTNPSTLGLPFASWTLDR